MEMNGLSSGQPQPFIRYSNESKAFPSPGSGGHLRVRPKFDECSSLVLQCYNLIRRNKMKVKFDLAMFVILFTWRGKKRSTKRESEK